jgi:hypothetical protein
MRAVQGEGTPLRDFEARSRLPGLRRGPREVLVLEAEEDAADDGGNRRYVLVRLSGSCSSLFQAGSRLRTRRRPR